MTPEEVIERHVPGSMPGINRCEGCWEPWPCDAVQMARQLAAAEATRNEARAEAADWAHKAERFRRQLAQSAEALRPSHCADCQERAERIEAALDEAEGQYQRLRVPVLDLIAYHEVHRATGGIGERIDRLRYGLRTTEAISALTPDSTGARE